MGILPDTSCQVIGQIGAITHEVRVVCTCGGPFILNCYFQYRVCSRLHQRPHRSLQRAARDVKRPGVRLDRRSIRIFFDAVHKRASPSTTTFLNFFRGGFASYLLDSLHLLRERKIHGPPQQASIPRFVHTIHIIKGIFVVL